MQPDRYGLPSLFPSLTKASSNRDAFTGAAGTRAVVRLRDVDTGVVKRFEAGLGNHSLEFRSEAFDLLNFVNYTNVSLSLSSPGAFGQFHPAARPRLLQLARGSKLAAEVKKRWR